MRFNVSGPKHPLGVTMGLSITGAIQTSSQTLFGLSSRPLVGSSGSATGLSAFQPPTWAGSIPDPLQIPAGSQTPVSLLPYMQGFDNTVHELQLLGGTLPSWLALNPTGFLVPSGAQAAGNTVNNISFRIVDIASSGDADWIAIANAPGVFFAEKVDQPLPIDTRTTSPPVALSRMNDPNVFYDTVIKPPGSAGCVRIDITNASTTNGPSSARAYFGGSQSFVPTPGDVFWCSIAMRISKEAAYMEWPISAGATNPPELKHFLFASYNAEHTNNQIVPGDLHNSGDCGGFINGGFDQIYDYGEVSYTTWNGSVNFRQQAVVDRGTPILTGNDPDTGAPWTAWDHERRRYGPLRSVRQNQDTCGYRRGYGDPLSGMTRYPVDAFYTLIFRTQIGAFDQPQTRHTVWMAPWGAAPQLVRDTRTVRLDASAPGESYNCLWMHPYRTNGIGGGRQLQARTNNITGVEILSVGMNTPIGNGTMSWNASTQRLTWAGAGQTAGTARGFSAANNILMRNVAVNGTESYVLVRFTPGQLPASNQTDTVTIADLRPTASIWYGNVVISTQSINAPGGFTPVLPP